MKKIGTIYLGESAILSDPGYELVTVGIQSSQSIRVQRLMQSELNSCKLWDM